MSSIPDSTIEEHDNSKAPEKYQIQKDDEYYDSPLILSSILDSTIEEHDNSKTPEKYQIQKDDDPSSIEFSANIL